MQAFEKCGSMALPRAVRKNEIFPGLRDAAKTWCNLQSGEAPNFFRKKHKEEFEGHLWGPPSDIVSALLFAVSYCVGCGRMYTKEALDELQLCFEYLLFLEYIQVDHGVGLQIDGWLTTLYEHHLLGSRSFPNPRQLPSPAKTLSHASSLQSAHTTAPAVSRLPDLAGQ